MNLSGAKSLWGQKRKLIRYLNLSDLNLFVVVFTKKRMDFGQDMTNACTCPAFELTRLERIRLGLYSSCQKSRLKAAYLAPWFAYAAINLLHVLHLQRTRQFCRCKTNFVSKVLLVLAAAKIKLSLKYCCARLQRQICVCSCKHAFLSSKTL